MPIRRAIYTVRPSPRVSGYKGGSDITKDKVYHNNKTQELLFVVVAIQIYKSL